MDEKLARMDVDLKAWKSRVETRKRFAQREIDKRTQILKEVRYYILYFGSYWCIINYFLYDDSLCHANILAPARVWLRRQCE